MMITAAAYAVQLLSGTVLSASQGLFHLTLNYYDKDTIITPFAYILNLLLAASLFPPSKTTW